MKNQTEEKVQAMQYEDKGEGIIPQNTTNKPRHWYRKRLFYSACGIVVIVLLAGLIWHKQFKDMWDNLFDTRPAASVSKLDALSTAGTTGSGGGSGGSSAGTTNRGTTSTLNQETSKTTSTTTTTTTTTTTPGDNGSPASDNTATLLSLSTNVKPGLTRDQVIALANGQGPSSCTDLNLTALIQQSICTWTADGKSVVVTLQNGIVTGLPVKIGF